MKKIFYLAMVVSMGIFAACDGDSSTSPNTDNTTNSGTNTSVNGSGNAASDESVTPFFPTGYQASNVVAWYTSELETLVEPGQTKIYVDAVYLFKDGSFIATESKVKNKTDRTVSSNDIAAMGTWSSESTDYGNGVFTIAMEEMVMPVEIKNGVFTINPNGTEDITFKLMSSAVPTPTAVGSTEVNAANDAAAPARDAKCTVSNTENSVTITMSSYGYTSRMVYTLTENGYTVSIEGDAAEPDAEPMESLEKVTLEELIQSAERSCAAMEQSGSP